MHGDEPGTDLNTVNGEPIRQQGQQGFGDQERYKLRGVWFPLCEHPSSFSHHAPPSLRKGLKLPQMWRVKNPQTVCQVIDRCLSEWRSFSVVVPVGVVEVARC